MCDTIVALGNSTTDGVALLAKNSDREPNEGQYLAYVPRAHHAAGETVRCTYLEIPQAEETYAVLLSKPFWMWGCEMGLNEHGVAIGNEAVFTREPRAKAGLLGMDMMRLALERTATARQALDLLIELLGTYGQGGKAGFTQETYYHNSFLIADPGDAWVLETAGRYWAAKQVHDVYTISNGLTIGSDWDLASPDLADHAIRRGWCRSARDFSFARCYSDHLYTHFSRCRARQKRSSDLAHRGALNLRDMMDSLRDHGPDNGGPGWTPARGSMGQICMHAGFGPTRPSQSTASLIARLDPQMLTCWGTGTSAPCTGIFKPIFFEAGLPAADVPPAGHYDESSLFWQHERLHRAVLVDYSPRLALYRGERDALEAEFVREAGALAAQVAQAPPPERRAALAAFTAACFARAGARTLQWAERVEAAAPGRTLPPLYRLAWQKANRAARMPGCR